MSPFLHEELYKQIKKVTGALIAVCSPTGELNQKLNDLGKIEPLSFTRVPTIETDFIETNQKEIIAVPIFVAAKVGAMVLTERTADNLKLISIIKSLGELVGEQFLEAHRPKADAVDILLSRMAFRSQTIDSDELEQTVAALGYRTETRRVAMVLELHGFWQNYLSSVGNPQGERKNLIQAKKTDIARVFSSFFSKNQDNIIGYIGSDRFVVLKDLTTSDFDSFCELFLKNSEEITRPLQNIYIKEVTCGIGLPVNAPAQLTGSLLQALQALSLGERLRGRGEVYRIDDLGVLPLVISSTNEQKLEFAERIVTKELDEELLLTLETFLEESLNLTQTAERLSVHRNTIIYRLDKIQEIVERDPRIFNEAVELYLALTYKKVFSPPTN